MVGTWKKEKQFIAIGFLPIVMIALVFGSYLGIVLNNINATPRSSLCNTRFGYDSSNPISVLVISSGSTGKICVEYSNTLNNSISLPSYITVYKYNSSGVYGTCGNCVFDVVSDWQVSASPNVVTFVPTNRTSPNAEKEIVTYSISVPSNVTSGIYGVFLLQFCSLFPIVVVPRSNTSAQLDRSDFSSWYPHSGSCPAQVTSSTVLGVSGFRVVSAT